MTMQDLLGAVEGGGTKFRCAVGTGPADIEAECLVPTTDPTSTLRGVIDFFRPYRGRLQTIGVCCFGPLELDRAAGDAYGSTLKTPKAGWSYVPLRSLIELALHVPVNIDTDVNGAALAEQRWGHGQGADPLVYVTVGTGIGVGVVIAGRPLHGLLHPELGHLRLPRAPGDSFVGLCPYHGDCLEGLASAPALKARAGNAPHALNDSDAVWDLEAHYLGMLMHAVVLAYAPHRIVLGGGVAKRTSLWPKLHAAALTSLADYIPRPQLSSEGITDFIVPSGLSDRAGLYGGFALSLQT